ncbi:prephenate dehydratase [Phycisphaeraceae bacterium D3-23]
MSEKTHNSTPPTPPDAEPKATEEALAPLRKQIDALDQQIVKLLNERAKVVVEVGNVKRIDRSPIFVPDRERRVLEQIRSYNQGPLPDKCIEAIWRELMSGSFALERALRIGYLGPGGSYSHQAAQAKFGASVEYDNLADIPMIFSAVERRDIDYGLVPIENSTEGSVVVTLDALAQTNARICAEVQTAIHHNLLANCAAPDIRRVYSHPQALAQCRQWLNTQFPNAEQVATSSTSRAAGLAAEESRQGAAAIASSLAAKLCDVHVQFENIEDNPNNTTRFLVIGHQSTKPTGDDKTALVFTTEHKAGALTEVLNVFRDFGLNLTHIDKRPNPRVNWEYSFFVDLIAHEDDATFQEAIAEAKKHCGHLTILGSFPRATQVI